MAFRFTKNLIYQVVCFLDRPKPLGEAVAASQLPENCSPVLNLPAYTLSRWQPNAPKIVEHVAMVLGGVKMLTTPNWWHYRRCGLNVSLRLAASVMKQISLPLTAE